MRRWIFAAALLMSAAPAALAGDHGRGRGHDKHHDRRHHEYEEHDARQYRSWAPAYTVLPGYHRPRLRPVPARYYESYGPVPRGCRRAYIDGYVVDYRPSNFLVINFSLIR